MVFAAEFRGGDSVLAADESGLRVLPNPYFTGHEEAELYNDGMRRHQENSALNSRSTITHRLTAPAGLRLGLLALGLSLLCTVHTFAQEVKTYIYVESDIGNPANSNSIIALSNDGSGTLTPLPGSPFPTGGTGIFPPGGQEFNADQQVMTDAAGTQLYAVNAHSNSIAGFVINADGSLTTMPNSPYPSNGQDPVSIGQMASSPSS
ncbi:MAG: hypothetical protein ABI233_05840 [Chthoniobacterales bacterium]